MEEITTAEIKGLEKGIKQEQIKSKEEKLKIAKSLLEILDEKTIAKKFGLSIEEINELKK